MRKRKRKIAPNAIPKKNNLMSIRVKLSKGYILTENTDPPSEIEWMLCNQNIERVLHLRTINGILEKIGIPHETYCLHKCCNNKNCPLLYFDFKTETQWNESLVGINPNDPPIIRIQPPHTLNREIYARLKACKTLQKRKTLTTTETENLVGAIIQATMPLFVSQETIERDKALGKSTTSSILNTLKGDTRWVDVAAWNVFLTYA